VPFANNSTAVPVSAVPLMTGVVALVKLSLFEDPESDSGSRSKSAGASGAIVSSVTTRVPEEGDSFPAVSVAFAVMLFAPSSRAVVTVIS